MTEKARRIFRPVSGSTAEVFGVRVDSTLAVEAAREILAYYRGPLGCQDPVFLFTEGPFRDAARAGYAAALADRRGQASAQTSTLRKRSEGGDVCVWYGEAAPNACEIAHYGEGQGYGDPFGPVLARGYRVFEITVTDGTRTTSERYVIAPYGPPVEEALRQRVAGAVHKFLEQRQASQ